MANARLTVIKLLLKMDDSGSYSNILLDSALSEAGLAERDKAFAAALFYGITERKMTLDYIIKQNSSVDFQKIEPETAAILRAGIYQLMFMDVPESAAVNESVKLCKKMKMYGSEGFVNGLLRGFIRKGKQVSYEGLGEFEELSLRYSCPEWIAKKWTEEYGRDAAMKALEASLGAPPIYARANSVKVTDEELIEMLEDEGISAEKTKLAGCIRLRKTGALDECKAFADGCFHIQDMSSQLCCMTLRPITGETVLDVCAAPGGKSFTMAELMKNNGRVLSLDLYEARTNLIAEGAKRLGLKIVEARANNAVRFDETLPEADRVLCDVPCSGLGVIRRKPEIKYKAPEDFDELPTLQRAILEVSSRYVKPGGTLVYSTCTLSKRENEEVAQDFAQNHPEFSPIVQLIPVENSANSPMRTFLPEKDGGDGFFTAAFRKIKE